MNKLSSVLPGIGGDRFGFAGRPGQTHPRAGRTTPETNTSSVPRRDAAPVERQRNSIRSSWDAGGMRPKDRSTLPATLYYAPKCYARTRRSPNPAATFPARSHDADGATNAATTGTPPRYDHRPRSRSPEGGPPGARRDEMLVLLMCRRRHGLEHLEGDQHGEWTSRTESHGRGGHDRRRVISG